MTALGPQPVEMEPAQPDPCVEFLREHEVRCPKCGQGLRHTPSTSCPNCGADARDAVTAAALLLRFVHNRSAICPRCGYNLCNLTQPICPECAEPLILRVGVQRIVVHWLLLALAPGTFCAIAMGIFVVMCAFHGLPRGIPWQGVMILAFLTISAIGASIIDRSFAGATSRSGSALPSSGWSI